MSRSPKAIERGESELVAAVREGDDRAFEQLYARYRERIFAFIVSRVHDHGRAEDIAQDVFIAALRRLRGSEGRIAFKPWIYEIAKNACIDEYRRGTRSREVPLETDGELITDRQAALAVAPPPAVAVEGKQKLDDLRGAFGGLSANHHRLLVMREFEGLSYDEIGTRLGMTRPMVESGLFRARRKLSEEYEDLASGRRCEQVQHAIEGGRLSSARGLGIRDRRRFARHLSHCQACRHVALQGGVDAALVQPRRVAERIAAFLPLPFLRRLLAGRGAAMNHPVAAALGGRAAATVVALVLAGAGGGVVHALSAGTPAHMVADHRVTPTVSPAPVTGAVSVEMRHPVSAPRAPVVRRSGARRRARGATRMNVRRHRRLAARHPVRRHGRRSAPRFTPPQLVPTAPPSAGASAAGSSSGSLPIAAVHIPSLASAIGRTVTHAVDTGQPALGAGSLGSLLGSDPLGSGASAASGLSTTLTSVPSTVLAGPSSGSGASAGSGGSSGSPDSGASGNPAASLPSTLNSVASGVVNP